jgi:hypothetical protein
MRPELIIFLHPIGKQYNSRTQLVDDPFGLEYLFNHWLLPSVVYFQSNIKTGSIWGWKVMDAGERIVVIVILTAYLPQKYACHYRKGTLIPWMTTG